MLNFMQKNIYNYLLPSPFLSPSVIDIDYMREWKENRKININLHCDTKKRKVLISLHSFHH